MNMGEAEFLLVAADLNEDTPEKSQTRTGMVILNSTHYCS